MPACSALGCKNRPERKVPGVTFHRFPKEAVLRAAWIVACRRKNWLPSTVSVLCNEHFSEDLIDRTSLARVRLRENAIPNIFKGPSKEPSHLKVPEDHNSPKIHLASTPTRVFLNDEETQSGDESTSETPKECDAETAIGSNSPENENDSSVEYVLPVPTPEKRKSPEKRLAFKPAMTFANEVVQSSHESTSKTPTIYRMIKPKVSLNSSINESSVENRPPVHNPEVSKFPRGLLFLRASTTFFNAERIQSSDESISKATTKCAAIQKTACLPSPVNESSVGIRPSVQNPVINKFPKELLSLRATATFYNPERIQSSDESISKATTECAAVQKTAHLPSPANESSVENRRLVQITKKPKFPEKRILSTAAMTFSSSEVVESSDESMSDTSTECDVVEPTVSLNPPRIESNVEIPVQESDSELYPTEDSETIYLKRKLAEANKLVSSYRKKIKSLQQQNRRCKARLEKAKRSIRVLEKANSVFL